MSEQSVFEVSFTPTDAGRIATIVFDDGKQNSITTERTHDFAAALHEAREADAVVIAGRPGCFSAGLDLTVVQGGDRAAIAELLGALGRAALALWMHPRPTVAAVTGHAIAGGAALALACDSVVAAEGRGKWGLPELALGLVPPAFVVELARSRLSPADLDAVVLGGALMGVDRALALGLVEEVLGEDELLDRAHDRARALAQAPGPAYEATKQRLRGARAAALLHELDMDIDAALDSSRIKVVG